MTQILGVVFNGLAFQASDRRLSSAGNLAPISDRANKSIVVQSSNAIALLGYTGLAELTLPGYGNVQMDSFLAGATCQDPVLPWTPPSHMNDLNRTNMGLVVGRIAGWLSLLHEEYRKSEMHSALGLAQAICQQQIQAVGFRRDRKKRASPFSFSISWDNDQGRFVSSKKRLFYEQVISPQMILTPSRSQSFTSHLQAKLDDATEDPPMMYRAIAESMQLSSSLPGVGGDHLVLCLNPQELKIHCYFIDELGRYPVMITPNGRVEVRISPWLVMPGLIQPPMVTNMSTLGLEDGLNFCFYDLPDPPKVIIAMPLDRTHKVGPQVFQLPSGSKALTLNVTSGEHTLELRGRTTVERYL